MICSIKYDASVDLWSVGVILYGELQSCEILFPIAGSGRRGWGRWCSALAEDLCERSTIYIYTKWVNIHA